MWQPISVGAVLKFVFVCRAAVVPALGSVERWRHDERITGRGNDSADRPEATQSVGRGFGDEGPVEPDILHPGTAVSTFWRKVNEQRAWASRESTSSGLPLLLPSSVLTEHRELLTSSGGPELCAVDEELGRGCYWCLQWDCDQGYYKESTPNCYQDPLTPVDDDFRLGDMDSTVAECSDATCCDDSYSGVFACKGYPCPQGYDTVWTACSEESSSKHPLCGESTCCGVVTEDPSVAPEGETPAPAESYSLAPVVAQVDPGAAPAERSLPAAPTADGSSSPEVPPSSAQAPSAPTVIGGALPSTETTDAKKVPPSKKTISDAVSDLSVVSVGAAIVASMVSAGASDSDFSNKAQAALVSQSSVSIRKPSATLAMLLVMKLQFIATLSLVDSTGSNTSWLSDLAEGLRWINLWPPASFAKGFVTTSEARSRPQEGEEDGKDDDDDDDDSSACFVETSSDLGALVFVGNAVLFLGILVGVLVLHVTVVSGVEAYWLSQQRANEELGKAQRNGIPIHHLATSRSAQGCAVFDFVQQDMDGGEEGAPLVSRRKSRRELHAETRNRSRSAWLYFPHIELVLLFFAFEGAVAAQLAAVRENGCPWVFFTASAALVLYPVLMITMIGRTFGVRVRPDALIVFRPNAEEGEDSDEAAGAEASDGGGDGSGSNKPGFLSRVCTGVREDHSMFAWADTGGWETAETAEAASEETRLEADRFRVGFEPLFVDFSKRGSWFMVYCLLEVAALAAVGTLIDHSVLQLFLFCGLCSMSFFLLVIFRPFANSVVNAMGACQSFADAVTTALLAAAAQNSDGIANYIDTTVTVTSLVCLAALAIPVYVDTILAIVGAIRHKIRKRANARDASEDQGEGEERREERRLVRRYIRGTWAGNWWNMLGSNVIACVRDTGAGIRRVKLET